LIGPQFDFDHGGLPAFRAMKLDLGMHSNFRILQNMLHAAVTANRLHTLKV